MEDLRLFPLELECLMALNQLRNYHEDNWVFTYSNVMSYLQNDPPKRLVVKTFKALRKKGLIRYSQCFTEDDDLVCGSGHGIELKGINYLKSIGKDLF